MLQDVWIHGVLRIPASGCSFLCWLRPGAAAPREALILLAASASSGRSSSGWGTRCDGLRCGGSWGIETVSPGEQNP